MDESCKHYAKRNKPDIKRQFLFDSPYMKYLEQANSQRQKID